ncbi:protein phosphatase 1 regulatory subunit 37 [Elysia marginata]|uniref:Protein phosphatase 1 regulatory subunit 37 n=1 Tax=Elysia marginata TaxID=1093978 RepID=A0AAV4HFR0_9GAST|nr:protein phosphatase 1 regulatory subunit 37 [Elysia marginata]
MADIGKDGNNLFQSIFHRAPGVLPSADCLNVNNEDASTSRNVNKVNEEDEQRTSTTTGNENGILPLSEEVKGPLKETLSIDPGDCDSTRQIVTVSNGCSTLTTAEDSPCEPVTNHAAHEDDKFDDPKVLENGVLSVSLSNARRVDPNVSVLKLEGTKSKCGKKRRICFPSDSFISGYHEPPDPWKNAPACTSEELVVAYKSSCDLNTTKPSAKILQQLQSITPTKGKREDELTLKGEKLDQRQCETIEEILRRVQFKLLDVEACHLDDECAQALFDMIEYYESACQLNISFNKNISVRGWQACARLVRRTPCLKYLDMRGCELNDRTIPLFGRALKLGCHLTILHMENMALSGRTLVILVAALKMNETLQELFLAENKLMPSDGVQLGNLMRYNHYLGLLDLRNNHLQALSETIETLNIGHNAITNEGAHLLKDGLLKTNSLLRLGLQGTRISDEGAVALAEYIADSTILLRVDLRDNDIKTGGLMALSHAMRVNTSVTRIDLDKDPKKESYMKDYAEQQGRLLRDILTFQQRNIEAALQQEEEERNELEKKAQAAAHVTATGNQGNSNVGNSEQEDNESGQEKEGAAQSSPEAFTIIEKSEAVEESGARSESSVLTEAEKPVSGSDESLPLPNLRPSHLFQKLPSCAQESLDSPLPFSAGREGSDDTQSMPCPGDSQAEALQSRLNISQEAPPAEMILSPQYAPRNMAKKIFSVSRVNEEPQLPVSSQAAAAGPAWDPLCASAIPLELLPCPSSTSALPIIVPPLSLASDFPHIGAESADSQPDALALSLCQAAVSESLPIVTDDLSQQTGVEVSPSGDTSGNQGNALPDSDSMNHQPDLSTAEFHDSSHFLEKSMGINSEEELSNDATSLHLEGGNSSSSGSGEGEQASQTLKSWDENSLSVQGSEEEQKSLVHQEDTISLAAEVAKKVSVNPSQDCVPSILPVSSSLDSASLQGSGDSGHHVKEGFVPAVATQSLGDGDNSRVEGKDIDPLISLSSCDSLPTQSHQQPVVEVNSDSPAVLDPGSCDNNPQESCEATESEFLAGSPASTTLELGDEDESWLAVGEDEAENKLLGRPASQQPDFFTTLSINGLTQELASALTSLDTSPGSSPDTLTEAVEGEALVNDTVMGLTKISARSRQH